MAKLILSLDDTFLGEYPLDSRHLTIGRRPTNDIHLDNLAVSGEHARVICTDGTVMVEDLDSTNGSTLNGRPVTRQRLRHGDVIGIGRYQLTFVDEAALGTGARQAPTDFAHTLLVQTPAEGRSPPAATAHATETPQAAVTSALPPAASVQVLNGPARGRELPLTKTLTTLGKPGEQVAVISRRPHGYYITHVEGDRHPLVNGRTIGAQAHPLGDHDVIELAGVKMEFFLTGA